MKKLTFVLTVIFLLSILTPSISVLADGGTQVYPADPDFRILVIRRGLTRYGGWPDGFYAKYDAWGNEQTRYIYWQNTAGQWRYFLVPKQYEAVLMWQEEGLVHTSPFFFNAGYTYEVWCTQRILAKAQ